MSGGAARFQAHNRLLQFPSTEVLQRNKLQNFLNVYEDVSRFCRWNGGGPRRLQTARKRTGRRRIEFAVVREPLERFLSGFVDKCLHEKQCYSCNGDMGCFVSKLTTSLFRYYRDENSSSDFHLDHFAPQNW
ncbi:hypothetical protein Q1695_006242 [Nippostrongylus brasiliensis]|nr:hypothetical protein Q1695_006242 [Nippostrongylus brasiliensis]